MTLESTAISAAALALLLSIVSIGNAQTRKPGYLGIRFAETVARTDTERTDRVVVQGVSRDSPAEKAGVQTGDEILRVNGLGATNGKFSALARTLVEGDTVRLRLKRDGKERDVAVVAAARPGGLFAREWVIETDSVRRLMLHYLDSARVHLDSARFPNIRITRGDSFSMHFGPYGGIMADTFVFKGDSAMARIFRVRPGESMLGTTPGKFHFEGELGPGMIFRSMELGARAIGGAELTEMDPSLAAYFNVDRGVLTLHVVPETPADRAGLQAGDVIVKAKDRAVYSVSDLRAIVASNPDGVKLEVLRKGQKKTLELKTLKR